MKQLSSLYNRICFLTVLEDGSPRSRCQQFCLLTRPLSLTCRWSPSPRVPTWIFLCVHASLDSPFLLIRTPGVLNEVSTSIPHLTLITSLKVLSQKTVNGAVVLQHLNLERQNSVQFSSVHSLSCVRLFVTPRTAARQASLSITSSWSSPKPMSIESVMPSNHLILCNPLLLLPPIPPSIRVFSTESTLRMRWPKYWSFSFSISPSK